MSQGLDEGMEDLMEKNNFDLGYTRKSKNIRHGKVPPDPRRQRKLLLLGSAGILLLVALVAISFRVGNKYSADALTSIHAKVDRLGEKLTRLERMEERIIFLEKQRRYYKYLQEDFTYE